MHRVHKLRPQVTLATPAQHLWQVRGKKSLVNTERTYGRSQVKYGSAIRTVIFAPVLYSQRSIVSPFHQSCSDVEEKSTIFSLEQIEALFKPRHMSGFLTEGGVGVAAEPGDALFTKLKEEPEDLTQLAPTPGDTIITLDFGVCQPSSRSECVC